MGSLLRGIFAPNLVPFDGSGRIDEGVLRGYVDWLIARGVHGLYPNGTTGEFVRLTADERRVVGRVVCEQAAGRVPVVVGATEGTVRETLAAAEAYRSFGAAAVAVMPPFYFKLGPAAVKAHLRDIALNSPADVVLYNIPQFASAMDVATIRELAEVPRVVGLKDSSGDAGFLLRVLAAVKPARPDFAVFTGSEAMLVPMLLMGADGGVHGVAAVAPEVTRGLWDAATTGRLSDARRLQLAMLDLLDAMLSAGEFPTGFRASLEVRGVRIGPGRLIGAPVDPGRLRAVLERTLESFGARCE